MEVCIGYPLTALHVNGVDDGFGIKTLRTDTSQYYYLLYWPKPSGQTFDALAPTFLIPSQNALDLIYGIAVAPNIFYRMGVWCLTI